MRNPFTSLSKIPRAVSAGQTIRQVLDRCLSRYPAFTDSVLASLSGSPLTEPPQELLLSARKEVCCLSGRVINEWSPGLCTQVFSTYIELSGDPDDCLPDWLNDGAPLGINREVSRRGIFPPVPDQPVDSGYLSKLVLGPSGWINYRSAENEPELTLSLLDAMVDKQWADKFCTWPQVEKALGTEEIVMNRLALISKLKPDGTLKHRLVWDLRRSGVNMAILQGERVVLPRLLDLVKDVRQIASESTPIFLMGTDVTEAFHQVPLHPSEQAYTGIRCRSVLCLPRPGLRIRECAHCVGQIRCLLGKEYRSDLGTRSRKAAGLRGRPYLCCGGPSRRCCQVPCSGSLVGQSRGVPTLVEEDGVRGFTPVDRSAGDDRG